MTDPAWIDELERLEKAATAGPWLDRPTPRGPDGWATCQAVVGTGGNGNTIYATPSGGVFPACDKALLIALRNAAPALIAAARREAKMREACQIASNCLKRIPDPDDAEKVTLDIINAALEDQTP